ncbi:hypothetical protein [Trinickia dinghuensis]|uniref:hypothetical protein n=1 Tax=Trinickia dinghuensis TaxID=2291023 RepID=UPI0015F1A9AC|nr:hypothetical protein [Trinickia dinghuensis]
MMVHLAAQRALAQRLLEHQIFFASGGGFSLSKSIFHPVRAKNNACMVFRTLHV